MARAVQPVEPERISRLNRKPATRGDYVLYWMQASQRAQANPALEYSIEQANQRAVPVVAAFGLTASYPEANERHYAFMLQGLVETTADLRRRGVLPVVRLGEPPEVAGELAQGACLVVTDEGYLRHQRRWRRGLARRAPCQVVQVASDVVVPLPLASPRAEYAARTIRPKLQRHWDRFCRLPPQVPLHRDSLHLRLDGIEINDAQKILAGLNIDRSVGRSHRFSGGTTAARRLLEDFVHLKLPRYARDRADPSLDIQSHMSPYLHFGQISPVEVALAVKQSRSAGREAKAAYLEELLVRRELAINFVARQSRYDSYRALPAWARATLAAHRRDRRPARYTRRQLELSQTHDPYWNAAMAEMRLTGKMHNTMRMYWGKKVLEWSATPQRAFRLLLMLNNKYFLDGRDPLSYANVAWCFGLHDRPWTPRPIFGTVRYMNAAGLERKYDIGAYVRWVESLRG